MQETITLVISGKVPIEKLLSDRSKIRSDNKSFTYHRGLYHDVLFLALSVFGAESFDIGRLDGWLINWLVGWLAGWLRFFVGC